MLAVVVAVACAGAALVALSFAVGLYQKHTNAMCESKKRLEGKTCVVTGGTAGMGLRIAAELARRGARVVVCCPYPAEGAAAVRALRERTGSERVAYRYLDLASLRSVREFAAGLARSEDRLDILINNAGVGLAGDFLTEDGLNFIMQVNYFGHFLLTLLLLPLLRETGEASEPSRIVNTASILHHIGRIDLDKMNETDHWYQVQLYGNSKLALVLFARELSRRMVDSRVVINTVDPGAVGTDIFNCIGPVKGAFVRFLFRKLYKTPWEGAQTALHAALDARAGAVSGALFKNCRLVSAAPGGRGGRLAGRLWAESVRLVGVGEEELARCLAGP